LDGCDARVLEQLLDKGPDHGTPQALTELLSVGEELIDSPRSGIGFIFPPSIA
jgi:hypothetical protein